MSFHYEMICFCSCFLWSRLLTEAAAVSEPSQGPSEAFPSLSTSLVGWSLAWPRPGQPPLRDGSQGARPLGKPRAVVFHPAGFPPALHTGSVAPFLLPASFPNRPSCSFLLTAERSAAPGFFFFLYFFSAEQNPWFLHHTRRSLQSVAPQYPPPRQTPLLFHFKPV